MSHVRRLGLAVVAALLVLVATGCNVIGEVTRVEDALERAGFRDASVSWYSQSGTDLVEVWWTSRAETLETLAEETLAAARVIWRVAPIHFDAVKTWPDTPSLVPPADDPDDARVFSREQLQSEFGPRPEGLDRSLSEFLGVGHYLRWAAFGIVLFLATAALIVWLVLRSSRRGRAAAA